MNRLTDNDHNFGPFTVARWRGRISASIARGDSFDEDEKGSRILLTAFGWALRVKVPNLIPFGEYGFALCNLGNGYDFFQIYYGPQTGDSDTEKSWCCHLPWKQWRCVRESFYKPNGEHFHTLQTRDFREYSKTRDDCPKVTFGFEDYDGEMVRAECMIEEREWHKGEGKFKWLRHFYPAKIVRSLDLRFSAEVGPEKGSWKGGTVGHGIDMLSGETPREAFERYCAMEHRSRDGKFKIRFVGECKPIAA